MAMMMRAIQRSRLHVVSSPETSRGRNLGSVSGTATPTADVVVTGSDAANHYTAVSLHVAPAGVDDEVVATLLNEPARSAYIHLPFCRARCAYCDFAVVTGKAATASSSHRRYVDAVKREIAMTADAVNARDRQGVASLDTVYFGGGTPSLLAPSLISEIVSELDRAFGISAGAEVTLELDPGTFDSESLSDYRTLAAVTRASLGVQSLDDRDLVLCNRQHNAAEARAAIDVVAASGITSWSVDVMHGLPHQTLEDAMRGLEEVLAYSPPHISLYSLAVERGTKFAERYTQGASPLPSDDECADTYMAARELLTVRFGYDHYENMSFAHGYRNRSQHNAVYWDNKPWHGFGMSAASNTFGRKYTRPRTLAAWLQWLRGGSRAIGTDTFEPPAGPNGVSPQWRRQAVDDTLIFGLRRAEGIDLDRVRAIGGHAMASTVKVACEALVGVVEVLPSSDNRWPRVRLTQPDGFLRENIALSRILAALDATTGHS